MNADEHRLTEEAMNALAYELRRTGVNVQQQEPIKGYYDGLVVGDYVADLLVADAIIVELKAIKDTPDAFAAQCLNYRKATGLPLCLLLNFGKPRVEIKRDRRESVFIRVHLWPTPHEPANPQQTP
jgi:GxxExxY protein